MRKIYSSIKSDVKTMEYNISATEEMAILVAKNND